MLNELIKEKNLPQLLSREEMLEMLQKEEYGYIPAKPESLSFEVLETEFPNFCGGNATLNKVLAHSVVNGKPFTFPFYAVIPTAPGKHPFFVHINFRPNVPDAYMPTEELVDNGFAVLSFCYNDVTKDDGDFTNGLAGVLLEDGKRGPHDPGKIAMWTWAAQRVMDYAQTRGDVLDLSCGIVCGHSRLGKTALLTGASDERFAFVYANESGCSGAAISRGKRGESVDFICKTFPYWFCENYQQYRNREDAMPFDQHFLIAASAPRFVLVGSAVEDVWADPHAEMLACAAAAPAFPGGFICEDRLPEIGDKFLEGTVGYHMRKGKHFFSRYDWNRLIEFVNAHRA